MTFLGELWRRNVLRAMAVYAVAAWLVLQLVDLALEPLGSPLWALTVVWIGLGAGLGVIAVLAWSCALTADGLHCDPESPPDPDAEHHTARRLDVILVSLVVIAVGLLVFDYSADDARQPGVDAHIRPELQQRLEAELQEDEAEERAAEQRRDEARESDPD